MCQEMAEYVLQGSDGRSVSYVTTASIAVFTYDTLLTLSREVEHIWKPRPFFSDTIYTASLLGHDVIFETGEHLSRIRSVITIQSTIIVGYDTIIFLITIWYMLSTVRRQRALPDQFEKKSILFLIVYQARHSFVLTVSVTTAVTPKTLRLSLRGVITPVQNFLSTTILCRFQLDLRERHVRRDDCTLDQVTLGTFKAATRRVREAVVDEFGDTELIDSLQMRQR
ncbi:hypothetical protein BU17DRAFT_63232 [Hysterangium stoloniferum]|nr:hypothetical protein BU17DRAFT_63232 [Hysterangium stoloniferum]